MKGGISLPKGSLAVIVLAALAAMFFYSTSAPASIISVSNVYVDGTNRIVAAFSVNSFDQVYFIEPRTLVLSNGTQAQMRSGIKIEWNPSEPFCQFTTQARTKYKYPVGTQTYYVLSAPQTHTPFDIAVKKTPVAGGEYVIESKHIDYTTGSPNTYTFTDSSGAKVQIQIAGQLPTGINCPSGTDAAIVRCTPGTSRCNSQGWMLTSKQQWENGIDDWNDCTFLPAIQQAYCFAIHDIQTINFRAPLEFAECGQYQSCPLGGFDSTTVDGSDSTFEYRLPPGSLNVLTTAFIDLSIADTVNYVPASGAPSISLALRENTVQQTYNTILTVTVRNTGTSNDVFTLQPSTTNGRSSFTPGGQSLSVPAGEVRTTTFNVYAYNVGQDSLCVLAQSTGLSGAQDRECTSFTITQKLVPTVDANGNPTIVPTTVPVPEGNLQPGLPSQPQVVIDNGWNSTMWLLIAAVGLLLVYVFFFRKKKRR
jgi:hypothetical protein